MKRLYAARILIGVVFWAGSLCAWEEIDARHYIDDIKYLSSKGMKGRASGDPELDKAARFLAKEFRKAGLRPLNQDSFLQPFPVSVKATLGANNRALYSRR